MEKENEKKLEVQKNTAQPNFLRSITEKLVGFVEEYRPQIQAFFEFAKDFNEVTLEDKLVERYAENPYFWKNVRQASKEFVNIPVNLEEDVLNYLCCQDFDVAEFKRLTGGSDVSQLKVILEEEEHEDYLFKKYIQDIVDAYQENPDSYRLYIPALFTVIEGTLGQVFHISKKGTAVEIKRKMAITWDIYDYIYANQFIGKSPTFWMQLFLTSTKEVFTTITTSSNGDVDIINRNKVLHGKSNPDDWTHDDFENLISMLITILFAGKTTERMTPLLRDIVENEKYERYILVFTETENRLTKENEHFSKWNEEKQEDKKKTIRKEMETDLCHLFGFDKDEAQSILNKSDFPFILEQLNEIKPST